MREDIKDMKKVAFTTLGCKVNQYDTDAMKGLFIERGYTAVDFDSVADIYVINTCSVTNMGEKKSRQLIRQAKRRNPRARIVVTGCYAQLAPEAIAAIEGVNLVIGTNNRHKIVDLVEEIQSTEETINIVRNIMQEDQFEEMPLYTKAIEKARAFMKIQEGCTNFCTFCIIPYTRGKLKSRQLSAIKKEAIQLVAGGYREIVLTGIHLGNYGLDLPNKPTLADVVKTLLSIEGLDRIRLGSIESVELSEELIHLIATEERVCSHLHLPLQAGHDRILKKMNRHYDLGTYKNLITSLRQKIPNLALTTDVIVGFPTETDAEFEESLETIREFGFTHIHVFPYSKREGTPAARMEGQVPEAVKKTRVALLHQVSRDTLARYMKEHIGDEVSILIEQIKDGFYLGFTDDYIHGKIPVGDTSFTIGQIVKGRVESVIEDTYLIKMI